MMLAMYRMLTTLGGPLVNLYLSRRIARGKEDPDRFGERLGRPSEPRPQGPLVWLHAASVGESLSLLPLIERLHNDWPGWNILLTTGTVTSAIIMAKRLPERALHQYLPVDRPAYVKRFLKHWRPDLALWAESEFWPNMIDAMGRLKVPLVLINGRVSAASFKAWRRFPAMICGLLSSFSLCLGQTEADAERLRALGAGDARCVGNLKFAAPPLPVDEAELAHLTELIAGRPRWLAASTHAGEESMVGHRHRQLKDSHPGLLTIVAPRHPERGGAVATELTVQGLKVALRSRGQEINRDTDIYIADTLGELGLFYRLCPIALIGKSVIGQGGQNPLEPARLNCAMLIGPHMDNFKEIAATLIDGGGGLLVADETAVGQAVSRLLDDDRQRSRLATAAAAIAAAEDGVLDAVIEELTPYLAAGLADGLSNGGGHAGA